jgi:type IV pilus assembly protein PilE
MNIQSKSQHGFSLIELVVAMLIAAILAAVAIPAYSNYTRKAHRVEAKNALLDMASLEERFMSTNNAYSQTTSDLGYGTTTTTLPLTIGSGYYQITTLTANAAVAPTSTTTVGTPATYTITVTAYGDQLKDTTCRTFTVTSAGAQTAQDSSSVDQTATCWH